MPDITQTCRITKKPFVVTEQDQKFYEKIGVPLPTLCPEERQRRRTAYRNERKLYKRTCDKCNKNIVSLYPQNTQYTVYCQDCWWGENWDSLEYGKDFDFTKPFFDQFKTLQIQVPRLSLFNIHSQNSEYTNHSANNKNCYMGVAIGSCEDCMYGHWITHSKNTVDSLYCEDCELCYEDSYCRHCYETFFSQYGEQLKDCLLCYECKNSDHCIGCVQLHHKKFYVLNKEVTEEEFKIIKKEILTSPEKFQEMYKKYQELKLQVPHRPYLQINCENVTGNDLYNCKNSFFCFNCRNLYDCKYMYDLGNNTDSMDCYEHGWLVPSELIYESHAGMSGYNFRFTHICADSKNLTYCDCCFNNSSNLFGCISLKHKKYSILNKQYTKEAYEELIPKIIEHMKKEGEWGEFFPISLSPFAYNETTAQEYFPLTKEEVLKRGYTWIEDDPKEYQKQTYIVPQNIEEVQDDICQNILACEDCKKNYRIIPQELAFYRNMKLPIPKQCSDCRHMRRMSLRPLRIIWDRKCMKCNEDIKTIYGPERKEIVYCEKCYTDYIYK